MAGAAVSRRHQTALWLAAGSFAFVFCFYHLSAALVEGVFLPADHDSFYHARRIVDALADPLRMYQFDPRIHAPEGSWLTWPWGYDMMMAVLARILMTITGAGQPMPVLAFIAPAWVFVNAALFLGIASRLRLSLATQVLAMLFFIVSPLTQALHRVGMLDHHYVEYTFVLASIYLGLGWFENGSSRRRAAALAVLLGVAPAFQNGLFILQFPVLMTVAWLWVLKRPLDRRAALAFAFALVATTAIFLVPSEPFRHGEFSYYLHSWFHLYVACCTALLCVLASVVRFTRAAAATMCVVAAGLTVPILPQLELGRDFLFTRLPYHDRIGELGNIPSDIAQGRLGRLTWGYSPLLWLLPFTLVASCWRLRRDASDASIHFLVQTLVGAFLLLQTFRLHYFGSFVLILPLCRLIDDAFEARPLAWRQRALVLGAVAVAISPTLLALQVKRPLGDDYTYMLSRTVYQALHAACQKRPGVVLAEHDDGHYIRYHSECSVIANNFITTPQHVQKIQLSEELLQAPIEEVKRRAPYVRYILVRRVDNVLNDERQCGIDCPENAAWRRERLLLDPAAQGLRLLLEVRYPRRGKAEPFARLFEVPPP